MIQKQECEQRETTSIIASKEPHLHWRLYFHKFKFFDCTWANFDVDKKINCSNKENKTTNLIKQKPICKGYLIDSELNDVLRANLSYHA